MALKTAPVKMSWRQGLLLQRQTTLQQAIMNCLTALSGHAANARCSTVAPRRRGGICTTDTPTYLQPNTRACAYGRIFLRMRSARNSAFSAPAKINFDTPDLLCGSCSSVLYFYIVTVPEFNSWTILQLSRCCSCIHMQCTS